MEESVKRADRKTHTSDLHSLKAQSLIYRYNQCSRFGPQNIKTRDARNGRWNLTTTSTNKVVIRNDIFNCMAFCAVVVVFCQTKGHLIAKCSALS